MRRWRPHDHRDRRARREPDRRAVTPRPWSASSAFPPTFTAVVDSAYDLARPRRRLAPRNGPALTLTRPSVRLRFRRSRNAPRRRPCRGAPSPGEIRLELADERGAVANDLPHGPMLP